ncbi:hypothetical protein EJ05DRAFT_535959 [Pseudovirgaria hyperparasitica]|uniref:Arabinosidase n=1 Tax=Pseudovirgaria hyperparasitica TaxID=470096 RepID=A0A6A6WIS3_9PEZI|nr:uncharacterized protein EJ05DRAFT_535959 [Pseudovirgaria hyperparasitica]KAF2761121.1 hypothetical protein EJ05DRAFT_535959 [Pseudovirgaria hyperparasitica]
MHLSTCLLAAATLNFAIALPSNLEHRNDKVGYLFTHFPPDDEAIHMLLSDGNNAQTGWKTLSYDGTSNTSAILRSDVGTKGVRDSHIVTSPDGCKHYLIATDLNAEALNYDYNYASRFGSLSIVVWESPDLINWSSARLTPPLVDASAGNVWAPEANWDSQLQAYIIVFAARYWSASDPDRTGAQPPNILQYVTTTDFRTFSAPTEYFAPGYPVIDATFLHVPEQGPDVWYRWVKSEVDYMVFQQRSEDGIRGTWTNVGGAPDSERIEFARQYSNNEGPLIFRDNVDPGLFHLWIDESTLDSYIPGQARTLDDMAAWEGLGLDGFPTRAKHGVVVALNREQYRGISTKYKVVA